MQVFRQEFCLLSTSFPDGDENFQLVLLATDRRPVETSKCAATARGPSYTHDVAPFRVASALT